MKMKSITAIVAFSITFGFSVFAAGLFGENNPTGQEISALLQQDIANGQEMDEIYQSASSPEYAEAVSDYVEKSQLIDDMNLPSDFRSAWQEHMEAWSTYADFLNRSDCMKKRMSAEQVSQISTEQNYQIMTTWLNVLKTGKRHGAIIPFNAY